MVAVVAVVIVVVVVDVVVVVVVVVVFNMVISPATEDSSPAKQDPQEPVTMRATKIKETRGPSPRRRMRRRQGKLDCVPARVASACSHQTRRREAPEAHKQGRRAVAVYCQQHPYKSIALTVGGA